MKDWEAFKLISDLVETLNHSAPVEFTLDAADGWFDATNDAKRKLLEARKPFEDRLYAELVEHSQYPWCDFCGLRVAGYASGWEHIGDASPWIGHEIETKGYHWGYESANPKAFAVRNLNSNQFLVRIQFLVRFLVNFGHERIFGQKWQR